MKPEPKASKNMLSADVHEALGIRHGDDPALVVEKLFCAAVLAEGTDVAARVFNRFCELRGALGSGITQQTKPAITPPTSGGKEYGTGG